ncbi:MAG: formylglycine-generating enzyme family protein [Anaerolineae bacterium]|nr:formylglycine-generating enzyme family protein [Anaerolineae bacterium]
MNHSENFAKALEMALARQYPNWEAGDGGGSYFKGVHKKTIRRWIDAENLPTPKNWVTFVEKCKFENEQELRRLYALAKTGSSQTADYSNTVVHFPSGSPISDSIPRENKKSAQSVTGLVVRQISRRLGIVIIGSVVLILGIILVLLATRTTTILERNRDWVPQFITYNAYELALVPAGCFNMGNANGRENERPVHKQCFNAPFWIGVTEVTQEQYGSPPEDQCNTNQISKDGFINEKDPRYPRNCVTWQQAHEWCVAHGMRLPTEAEWEYAARGVENWLYPWGNDADPIKAVVRINFSNAAIPGIMQPAGSKPYDVSWVGAKDLAGSLREYTSTIYDTVTLNGTLRYPYPYDPNDGRESLVNEGTSTLPTAEERSNQTTLRVLRGGSFDFGVDQATATWRKYEWYDFLWNDRGFRCASDYDIFE